MDNIYAAVPELVDGPALEVGGLASVRVRPPPAAPFPARQQWYYNILMTDEKKQPPGPKPDRVKIDKDWEEAVGDALKKKRPAEGWPKPEKKPKD